jgi:hypothetical protein
MDDEQDIMRRAFAAWYRTGHRGLSTPDSDSCVQIAGGLRYAVLRGGGGVLAVYRVQNNGRLKGLRRWPKELGN